MVWFIPCVLGVTFLGLFFWISVQFCQCQALYGNAPWQTTCSAHMFPLKRKNPAHNRKSLYCMPRRLGLVKYILLVNNYPIKKVALVWISFEQVHLTRGIFAGIKTSWITVVKMCSGFLIKSTIQWPFFFVLFCFHLLQPSKSAEIFPVGDFGGWRRFIGVSVSEDHSVCCWKIKWQRRCLVPPK